MGRERVDGPDSSALSRRILGGVGCHGASALKQQAVYVMTNGRNGTLYVGVTSDLARRVWQHRESELGGFTARYGCTTLVWFELHDSMVAAIALKSRSRVDHGGKSLP